MHKVHRHKYVPNIEPVRLFGKHLIKMVQMQYAYYVINRVLINGYARISRVVGCFKYFPKTVLNVYRDHVHARGYDLVCQHIVKIKRALQQIRPILVYNAFVLNGIYYRFKIVLRYGVGRLFIFLLYKLIERLENALYQPYYGERNYHERLERYRRYMREAECGLHGNYLWHYLAER